MLICSMTGFGRGQFQDDELRILVEVKTVNHRYNETVVRIPRNMISLEERIRKIAALSIARGKVEVYVNMEFYKQRNRTIHVDQDLAKAYYEALSGLKQLLDMPDKIDFSLIAKAPEVTSIREVAEDIELLWPKLETALKLALQDLQQMRHTEGQALKRDLLQRLQNITANVQFIEKRAPMVVQEYREKLTNRVQEHLAAVTIDEGRILQEILLLGDRVNVNEELVRLGSHIEQFGKVVTGGGSIGRKLDFIVQELNREVNTIGSKANDFEIASYVVELKSDLEKIREQVQNLE